MLNSPVTLNLFQGLTHQVLNLFPGKMLKQVQHDMLMVNNYSKFQQY